MALIRLQSLCISFGDNPVLAGIDAAIDERERIALVGRNGTGKSTLLKLLAGKIQPDSGEIVQRQNLQVALLRQDVPHDISGSVQEIVAEGLAETGALLAEWFRESDKLAAGGGDTDRLSKIQSALDAGDGWQHSQRIDKTLSRMQLDGEARFDSLSGGMKRRVLLAQALVAEPDILLLDEPTNHLDIPAIDWLESYLPGLRCSLVFITHDRRFLKNLATRILELDRGQLTDWPGNYEQYLEGKTAQLETEQKHNALFDKKLAQEETWIRQGIKARRTRNEGRVRALKKLREERRARIEQTGQARMQANAAGKSGKRVIEATGISYQYDDQPLIRNFSTTIMRGDKIGVMGPNGVGKSTLIRLLLGELAPQQGNIEIGTNLEVAYFDQLRGALRQDLSAMDNVSGGKDTITVNGQQKHIIGYLQDFLFTPARARAPITALSGGETNRLMLAKLFLQPSNLLVLDEPTNDLDIETLELLESLVADYHGTVILISHDRAFIDNTVTSIIMFEGNGVIREYVGGYSYWSSRNPQGMQTSRPEPASGAAPARSNTSQVSAVDKPATRSAPPEKPRKKKLSYKDQRELDELPARIEKLEQEIADLETRMSQPEFYQSFEDATAAAETLNTLQLDLETALERWVALES